MNLKKLLNGYTYNLIQGDLNINITSISNDSREIIENSLFIAEKGWTVDGHNYIEAAIDNGAKVIVLENLVDVPEGITIIQVDNSIDAMAFLSNKYYHCPSEKLQLIGVTGTNGKTSTTYFLKSIFETSKIKTGLIGTMGSRIGEKEIKHENTTPNSLIINKILKDMVDENLKYGVMEVSSHALALKRVEYLTFKTGIWTNLSKDHLDYHKNIDNYFKSKLELFKRTGMNIINIDDSYGLEIIKSTKSIPHLTYGLTDLADVYASNIKFKLSTVNFDLNIKRDSINITLGTPGEFSVYNALAAAACGYYYGFSLKEIKNGLEEIKGVKGRFEVIPTNTEWTAIIDFAHTADGLKKVLEIINQFVEGRKIVLFGAGGDRDRTKRPEMGEVVGRNSDIAIITSDNPRSEDPDQIIKDIEEGIKKTQGKYVKITDRIEAIKYAIDIAKKGDIILLAGKGHETWTIINDEKIPCDERKIVLDYIKNIT